MTPNQLRRWITKFACALRGLQQSIKSQESFWVHLPVAAAVVVVAAWLKVEPWRWAVLVIAITLVLSAELFNTAIETIVKVVHPQHDPRIGHSLDTAAAAVLVLSIGAAILGAITLGLPLWEKVAG